MRRVLLFVILFSNDSHQRLVSLFFFNDTATTEIYTLSLHDALPISGRTTTACPTFAPTWRAGLPTCPGSTRPEASASATDRKSTRLNSSHSQISYAVFCLKKKKKNKRSLALELGQIIRAHTTTQPVD